MSYFVRLQGKLPPRLAEDEILALLQSARAGNQEARNALVLGNMRLVASIAARFCYWHPRRAEDIFATALYTLVIAVDRVCEGIGCSTHDNIQAYIHKYVHWEIVEQLKIDHTVRPPLNSSWLVEKLQQYGSDYLSAEFGTVQYVEGSNITAEDEQELPILGCYDEGFDYSANELLASDLFTSRERIILRMRIAGSNCFRIGKALGCSERTVRQMLNAMEKRATKIVYGKY